MLPRFNALNPLVSAERPEFEALKIENQMTKHTNYYHSVQQDPDKGTWKKACPYLNMEEAQWPFPKVRIQ